MLNKVWNNQFKGVLPCIICVIKIVIEKCCVRCNGFLFRIGIKECGKCIHIGKGVFWRYPSNIICENDIVIGNGTHLSTELSKGSLLIRNGVSIGKKCIIDFTGGIEICEDAHIAHDCLISTHDHGYDYKSTPIGKSLKIGKNVFIGNRVVVLHNVSYIGENAVIGTSSIVTKNVPDNAIVAGNPAKIIKYRN